MTEAHEEQGRAWYKDKPLAGLDGWAVLEIGTERRIAALLLETDANAIVAAHNAALAADQREAEVNEWATRALTAEAALDEVAAMGDAFEGLQRREAALQREVETLRAALEPLAEHFDGECRFDHHGYCQAHLVDKPCSVAAARAALTPPSGPATEAS